MKILAIYTKGVRPLAEGEISLINDWTEEVESNVLLTGPNGCGKSTLLRAVAMLWDAAGYWLDQRKVLPKTHSVWVPTPTSSGKLNSNPKLGELTLA